MFRPYVSFAGSDFISIDFVYRKKYKLFLEKMGFSKEKSNSHNYSKDCTYEEMIKLFQILNDNGFAFSCGKEWNPADLYEYYREQGLLNGKFRKVFFIDGFPFCYWK